MIVRNSVKFWKKEYVVHFYGSHHRLTAVFIWKIKNVTILRYAQAIATLGALKRLSRK